jgi:cytidylate kinase
MSTPKRIAIDGPAASGKSTLAEKLANHLGYLYFDTGVMYRAVTLAAMERLHGVLDEQAVTRMAETIRIDVLSPSVNDGRKYDVLLDGRDITWMIRTPQVEANVSPVSAYKGVREAMTQQQRRIGQQGNVVMVGRDIGTVVMPDADLKIYLEATVEERARRRFMEVQQRGGKSSYEEIFTSLLQRDQIDSNRLVAPLRKAEDAILIDSDGLTIEEVLEKVKSLIE